MLLQSATLLKPAAYFKLYWNSWVQGGLNEACHQNSNDEFLSADTDHTHSDFVLCSSSEILKLQDQTALLWIACQTNMKYLQEVWIVFLFKVLENFLLPGIVFQNRAQRQNIVKNTMLTNKGKKTFQSA